MDGRPDSDEMQDSESLLLVGQISRPHGVQGEVKIVPTTDDPSRFADLDIVYIGATAIEADAHRVETVRLQPTGRGLVVIMKIEGVDTREQVETLRRRQVFARASDLPPLDDDEFYIHDLIGLEVVTDTGELVGPVDDVMTMPAQQVLVVARRGRNPAMIPIVHEFVEDINLEERKIIIRPIEGLLD